MSQSFDNPKELRFVITLGSGTFGSTNSNTITLQGYRAVVDIDKAGGLMAGTLRASIYGVSQSDMNSCVTFPLQPGKGSGGTVALNTIQVFAIDGDQQTSIFQGNIVNAWGNYQNMPDVFLQIQAQSAFAAQITPVAPRSFSGSVDTSTIMAQIAQSMGLTFENNNVSKQLVDLYLPNTDWEQAKSLTNQAGIWMCVDDSVLAITPAYSPRASSVPEISPTTGLRGYPTFDSFGVNFQMLFNPAVKFLGSFNITSSIPQANGVWIATSIAYQLDSEKPNGRWFQTVRGTKSGLAVT